jgi:inner membrane protease subunit 1
MLRLGDLVVATSVTHPDRQVLKRVLGLEGDTVLLDPRASSCETEPWLDSTREEDLDEEVGPPEHGAARYITVPRGHMWLGESDDCRGEGMLQCGRQRDTGAPAAPLFCALAVPATCGALGLTGPCSVGDNLPMSNDSRHYGPVPLGLLKGVVVAKVRASAEPSACCRSRLVGRWCPKCTGSAQISSRCRSLCSLLHLASAPHLYSVFCIRPLHRSTAHA